ncbi:MAG: T9SS type A sorting domain-containing protein [Flavobacteriales bacterium]|nr:T9SS type A sorting domain-containing protein [Flavobacteriales bacterium]
MKKVYLMAFAMAFGITSIAQVDVTFQVDMNGETVSENGVHVAGNWQDEAGFPEEWNPGSSELTDGDGDGIYELSVTVPPGMYEYKFVNDNDWPGVEGVPVLNQKGGGNDNRVFVVSQWHADNGGLTLPAVQFGGSAPEGQVAVRFVVDLANEEEVNPLGVHVAGDFSDPVWTPQLSKAWQVENNVYAFVANVNPDQTYSYKFINGDFWTNDDGEEQGEVVPDDCATDGNRAVEVVSEDVVIANTCFSACGPCAIPSEVTLTVDMSAAQTVEENIFCAGSFNGYSDEPMTDNGDGTYTIVLSLAPGEYFFKFKNGPDGWENVPPACQGEGTADRVITVVEEQPLSFTSCFEQCSEECTLNPDPANITFRVDMNEETVSAEGVYIMGSFTSPAWQDGAVEMTDADSDGIYETTIEVGGSADIQYKFTNGDPNVSENEESGDFQAGGCGAPNGIGGFNRTHTRSGEDEVLPAVAFNSCQTLSLEELEVGEVSIFPNPSDGMSFIRIENPRGYTLRMNIVDITGKLVRENVILNSTQNEINTSNLNAGLYFLNVVNEKSERGVYKLMVK